MKDASAVVVVAGGGARRFGADKLAAPVRPTGSSEPYGTVLDAVVHALPATATVIVVGPERPTRRPVHRTREDPPGGGPAAAIVAGLRCAAQVAPDLPVSIVPGDAPGAGEAVPVLLSALAAARGQGVEAVIGTDRAGRPQPLHAALAPAAAARLVGHDAVGGSAKALLATVSPRPVVLAPSMTFDVDHPSDLAGWRHRDDRQVIELVRAVDAAVRGMAPASDTPERTPVLALHGSTPEGRSALATAVRTHRDIAVANPGRAAHDPVDLVVGIEATATHGGGWVHRSRVDITVHLEPHAW